MKLHWPVTISGTGGPTRGYRGVSESLRAALEAAGVEWSEDAPIWLHVCPPHIFEPEPGRINVLLSMLETDQNPPDLIWRMGLADLLIVPCEHNRTVLKWAGYRKPIRVVPLAVGDAHLVDVGPRPDGPFRILWVGQANVRKGPHLVNDAFRDAFGDRDAVQLVMKTVPTAGAAAGFETGVGRVQIIARPYTDAEMAALYRSAHAFVFPSYGEGWGLPVLEAMAAECLVLAPVHTGLADFFDARVGWPLAWHRTPARYGVAVSAYEVDAPALVLRLRRALECWPLMGGLRARARARALTFTWIQTARRVLDALAPLADRLLVSA
jgi:glycosyltransferase involved in cell wall biosynthesis